MTILLTILYVAAIIGVISFVNSLLTFDEDVSRLDRILLSFICGVEALRAFSSLVGLWS